MKLLRRGTPWPPSKPQKHPHTPTQPPGPFSQPRKSLDLTDMWPNFRRPYNYYLWTLTMESSKIDTVILRRDTRRCEGGNGWAAFLNQWILELLGFDSKDSQPCWPQIMGIEFHQAGESFRFCFQVFLNLLFLILIFLWYCLAVIGSQRFSARSIYYYYYSLDLLFFCSWPNVLSWLG